MTPLIIPKQLTVEFIHKHKDKIIFVFGDNLAQRGFGGQARVCRLQPNCYGIPTKRAPCNEHTCFFNDDMYKIFCAHIDKAISLIPRNDGRQIYVIPGIGEGLSRMPEKCPKVFKYMIGRLYTEFAYMPKGYTFINA